ncbi:MAG: hypothetical protein L0L07_00050 [Staphylococcus equorum]|nr:hypothetical protein [Staphylococcus equorum]
MACVGLFGNENVYDYLPGDVGYPFVFVGEQFKQNDRKHKDYLNGSTQVTVHVWHNDYKKRGTLSDMMTQIEEAIQLKYGSKADNIDTQIITDTSTGAELLHGIVEVSINY